MEYSSAREWTLKIKLHMKVCNSPPKGFEVKNPKVKSMYDTKRSFTILQR